MSLALLLEISATAMAADDLKVSQLEQDVRDLQRQVQALARQIEPQRLAALPPAGAAGRPRDPSAAPVRATPAWVDAAKWQRVKPGMGELDVIGILGSPTSMRLEEGARVLLYALEIGSAGFLGGSVTLRDRSVVSIRRPTLQ